MRLDKNLMVFLSHTEWYRHFKGVGYVPTEEAPENAVVAMKRYNSYSNTLKDLDLHYWTKYKEYISYNPRTDEYTYSSEIPERVKESFIAWLEYINNKDICRVRWMGLNMKTFKAKYISDIKSIFLKKGEIYDVYIPEDNPSESFYAIYLDDMDEPGYYAIPASRFEKVE